MRLGVLLIHGLCVVHDECALKHSHSGVCGNYTEPNGLLRNAQRFRERFARKAEEQLLIERIQYRYVTFELIGCTKEEAAKINVINDELTSGIAKTYLTYLPIADQPPQVTVWCLGSHAPMGLMPIDFASVLEERGHMGAWFGGHGIVAINLRTAIGAEDQLVRVVAHELSHAFMSILTWPYSFPSAICEGMALSVEIRFASDRVFWLPSALPEISIPPATPCSPDAPYWAFSELIGMDMYERPLVGSLCSAAYRLLLFLAVLNHPQGPISCFLYRLLTASLNQEDVLAWICGALGMTQKELDVAFEEYWCQGTVSCKSIG